MYLYKLLKYSIPGVNSSQYCTENTLCYEIKQPQQQANEMQQKKHRKFIYEDKKTQRK